MANMGFFDPALFNEIGKIGCLRLKVIQNQSSKRKSQAAWDARMGETLVPVISIFNSSLRVKSRADRLNGDP